MERVVNSRKKQKSKKYQSGKSPGLDSAHRFCFKKFTSIHDRLATEMNRILNEAAISEWMTKGKTAMIQKDPHPPKTGP